MKVFTPSIELSKQHRGDEFMAMDGHAPGSPRPALPRGPGRLPPTWGARQRSNFSSRPAVLVTRSSKIKRNDDGVHDKKGRLVYYLLRRQLVTDYSCT
jgi:hypothetical protein